MVNMYRNTRILLADISLFNFCLFLFTTFSLHYSLDSHNYREVELFMLNQAKFLSCFVSFLFLFISSQFINIYCEIDAIYIITFSRTFHTVTIICNSLTFKTALKVTSYYSVKKYFGM